MEKLDSTQNDNTATLKAYQDKTQSYVDGTPPIDDTIKIWLNDALTLIPKDGKVLEIGSGFGRDAEYVREQGFIITCTDAVPNFVSLLQEKGFESRMLNVLSDTIPEDYAMVLADAVLLHFTPEEAVQVTRKIFDALPQHGVFALRMKKGNGAVWSDEKLGKPRYFYYWPAESLQAMLTSCGFSWVSMTESHTSHNNASWMHIIVQKP